MKRSIFKTGYSLVEVLIAVSILMLAIAGPMTIAQKGLQSSYFARDQLTAFMLAQEASEAFFALRNEAVLEEISGGSPDFSYSNLWDWTNDANLATCFGVNGCNLDFSDETLINNVVECDTESACLLDYDESEGRARFVTNKGSDFDSLFTRVIKLEEVVADRELSVEVTVSWQPAIFCGARKEVFLRTSVFNIYGR